MFYQIINLLLEVATDLTAGACLLRLYMQHQRISMSARSGNPVGNFIFALTDWLVLPLRRVIPAMGRWDLSSLVGAYLLELARFTIMWVLLTGANGGYVAIPLQAVFALVALVLSGLLGILFIYVILSWVQANSPMADILERLCAPMLQPIRRVVPLVGGFDLSPLVLMLLIQIAKMVLGSVYAEVMGAAGGLY